MIRIVLFVVLVGAVAALAVFVADEPGRVEIAWGDWLVETSPGALAAAVAAVAAAVALVWQVLRWLLRGPDNLARVRRLGRQRRGYRALTLGFVAAAAGDGHRARRLSRRANLLLEEPPLTLLLSAQAAQLEGDDDAAAEYFEAMLARPETEFLGLRGLLVHANRSGERERARDLAERAYRIRPEAAWVLTALLELRTRDGNFSGALKVLKEAERNDVVTTDVGKRRRAALLVEAGRVARRTGDGRDAQRLAGRAVDAAPGFVPGAIAAAETALAAGRNSAAAKIIERAWRHTPHPGLATAYRAAHEARDAVGQMKRLERLAALNPDHPESHLMLAAAALEVKLWGTARQHLVKAEGMQPGARTYRLLARLEEDEHGNTEAAHAWLIKASEAPSDPVWRCGQCGIQHASWSIACSSCGALDTLDWGAPVACLEPPAEAGKLDRSLGDSAIDSLSPDSSNEVRNEP